MVTSPASEYRVRVDVRCSRVLGRVPNRPADFRPRPRNEFAESRLTRHQEGRTNLQSGTGQCVQGFYSRNFYSL